jgi:hypothetical protein
LALGNLNAIIPTGRVQVAITVREHQLATPWKFLDDVEQFVRNFDITNFPRLRLPVLLRRDTDDACLKSTSSDVGFSGSSSETSHQVCPEDGASIAIAFLDERLELVVIEHADFWLGELHVLHGDESFAGIEIEHAANELVYAKALVGCSAFTPALIDQVLLEAQQVNTSNSLDGRFLHPFGKLFQCLLHERMRLRTMAELVFIKPRWNRIRHLQRW